MRRISAMLITSAMLRSTGTLSQDAKMAFPPLTNPPEVSPWILKTQKDWDKISELHKRATQILIELKRNSNDPTLLQKRKQAFGELAKELEQWIGKHERDINSLLFLRATYRLGNFWEHADENNKANDAYQVCNKHPLLRTATYEGRPLAKQLASRLKVVEEKKGKVYSSPGVLLINRTVIIGGGKSGGGKSRVRRRVVKTEYKLDKSKPPINVDDMIR